ALTNIAALVSGSLGPGGPGGAGRSGEPELLDADTLLVEEGRIAEIGRGLDASGAERVLDCAGTTVAPGLIDGHVHVVIGDYTPRQKTVDFLESYMHGGITSVVSPGEVHAPGRPSDPVGVKALALAAQRCFRNFRPGGMKVHAGSVLVEPGLEDRDFEELAREGVWLAKVGFGRFERQREAAPLVRAAQAHGFKVLCHTGGASIPGSAPVLAEDLLEIRPDIAAHVNGGTTALPDGDLERVVRESDMVLQVCQAGNLRSALRLVSLCRELGQLGRINIASDTPTGTGVMPLGTLKSVVELASLGGLRPEAAWAMASGLAADAWGLDDQGKIEVGRAADLVVMDAPLGSAAGDALEAIAIGDIPGITAVLINGEAWAMKSRNTPAATRYAKWVRVGTSRGEG
ncbi:MAG: amidohydrolase family protein, partial [Nitrospinota bacterium]